MKKIHIRESKLNEIYSEKEFCAGTDHPYYENEETGEVYSADWNSDYGFPFGFWPIDYNRNEKFVLGEAYTTHGDACGQCAQEYVTDILSERLGEQAQEIETAFEDFVDEFKEYGYKLNDEDGNYYSSDGSEVKDEWDFINQVNDYISDYAVDSTEYVGELVRSFLEDGVVPYASDIEKQLYELVSDNFDFTTQQGVTNALRGIDMDFYEYFEMGNGEGRVWPYKEMIGFYESEQPSPDRLEEILYNIQNNGGPSVQDMLQYHMVFEDWRNDGTITACTVQDYIDGNYGPESYEDLDDEDDTPIQYNNGQKTIFVPHLANQQDKFNYYKDFRNTRDRAVYAPQERAAGNLAAYHAMRYPYGESKDRIGKIIREVIEDTIKMGLYTC